MNYHVQEYPVQIPLDGSILYGELAVPPGATGVVLFAHGSGSTRHSPRNHHVAQELTEGGLATLLFDLLTEDEGLEDERTRELRFEIGLLAERLVVATDWLAQHEAVRGLPFGYFGASTGAAIRGSAASTLGRVATS